jgi:hypothetical protein
VKNQLLIATYQKKKKKKLLIATYEKNVSPMFQQKYRF